MKSLLNLFCRKKPIERRQYLRIDTRIPVHLKVEFNIDDKPINAIARMVAVEKPEHTDSFYMRLEFIKIDEADRKKIIDFINSQV
jgi:c-di-GMP-binding flagellar brake protein YcgR